MFKNAMAGAAALGLIFASTAANAEAVRATAALPGVVSVNKHKVARTAAPAGNESKGLVFRGDTLWLSAVAAVAAGTATYFAVRGDGTSDIIDSPGA